MSRMWLALGMMALFLMPGTDSLAAPPPTKELVVKGRYLLLPVRGRDKPDGTRTKYNSIRILVDGVLAHQFWASLPRSKEEIQFWSYVDVSEYVGKTAYVRIIRGPLEGADRVLSLIETSDELRALKPLYTEQGRPQFHFSQRVGWNNDVNGMVYSDGLYHLSWQCNPVGRNWNNMYWGHAVSKDLVHWEEWPRIIRTGGSVAKGQPIHPAMAMGLAFSGSACVDGNNTLGKQVGETKTLIACFTDIGAGDKSKDEHGGNGRLVGESLAYSTDNGRRYTLLRDFNPIISHHGRDPKLFWYEPGKHWCIVTYRDGKNIQGRGYVGKMAFYSSKDLKTWTFASYSDDVFHECPEFVELPVDGDPNNKRWLLFDATPKYQIGTFDGKRFTPDFKEPLRALGGSIKAAQCFSNAPDGRAICMVWSRVKYGEDAPFNQGFTLPIELTLKTAVDGPRLYANPVKELDALHDGTVLSV
ncbi:glycoside hydrolase family 32 protein, partial [bacterium]|nr:glycoside hydrolase family 32 protein [bacterium]